MEPIIDPAPITPEPDNGPIMCSLYALNVLAFSAQEKLLSDQGAQYRESDQSSMSVRLVWPEDGVFVEGKWTPKAGAEPPFTVQADQAAKVIFYLSEAMPKSDIPAAERMLRQSRPNSVGFIKSIDEMVIPNPNA